MKYFVLASGSAGNSTFIDFGSIKVLIDCGISKKQLVYRLSQHGYQLSDIDHVFLTHNHNDHDKNIHIFNQEIVYCGKNAIPSLREDHFIRPYDILTFQDVTVIALSISHDATSPLGFVFIKDNKKLVYMTDTGYVSKKNASYMRDASYYIIESNHDVEMLMSTRRPMFLKNRILSDYGHLSNEDSALIMSHLLGPSTQEIVLAHLSREANTNELALGTYHRILEERSIDTESLTIKVASQVDIVFGGNIDVED